MKRLLTLLIAWPGLLAVPGMLSAQFAAPKSPEIHPDGSVTFRLKAPEASRVALNGDWPGGAESTNAPMVKDDQGVWSVTVGPIKPDLWYYSFSVDGVKTPDDLNVHFDYDGGYKSPLLIPGPVSYNYEMHDVPHGTVSAVWYPAPTLKMPARRAMVYTPPGYETSHQKYPVLYLVYGEETGWMEHARASTILDNLIASRKAKPMIVVMPSMQLNSAASPESVDEPLPSTMGHLSGVLQITLAAGGGAVGSPAMLTAGQSVARDLVPFIDKTYRTRADRDHRAIAGLSSPGAQGFYTGMTNLKIFGSIGTFSGGFPTLPGVDVWIPTPAHPEQYFAGPDLKRTIDPEKLAVLMPDMNAKANLHVLYLSIGTNDALMTTHNLMKKLLDEKGLKYINMEVPGYHHEWRFWRWSLNDFAPRLFQDTRN